MIKIPIFLAKIILDLISIRILNWYQFNNTILVCKGYNEDEDNYTELVWNDDKDLDFNNKANYWDFQVWYN